MKINTLWDNYFPVPNDRNKERLRYLLDKGMENYNISLTEKTEARDFLKFFCMHMGEEFLTHFLVVEVSLSHANNSASPLYLKEVNLIYKRKYTSMQGVEVSYEISIDATKTFSNYILLISTRDNYHGKYGTSIYRMYAGMNMIKQLILNSPKDGI